MLFDFLKYAAYAVPAILPIATLLFRLHGALIRLDTKLENFLARFTTDEATTAAHGKDITIHGVRLDDHEKRITKLEG